MLRVQRPAEPPGFAARVADARARLAAKGGVGLTDDDFPPLWREYKPAFAGAQHHKCGYCESKVTAVCHGDVEHYRPKAAIQDMPVRREDIGREVRDSASVEGRRLPHLCAEGYWWLAYEWSNYLLACPLCNQSWKRCLFPIEEAPRCVPPRADTWETPLVLNPFDAEDLVRHFAFDDLGQVSARDESAHGRATIDTCGLDRESLREARHEKARSAHRLAERLQQPISDQEVERILDDFAEMGDAAAVYAGMVRAILEQVADISWDEYIAPRLSAAQARQ